MSTTLRPSEAARTETERVVLPRRGRRRAPAPRRPGLLKFGHWWWALPGIVFVIGIHYVATSVGGFFAFTNWTGIGAFQLIGLD
ncbi:hypothetical protein ACSTIP_00400, partial [Vibrio parahaemolyticus]